MLAKPLGENCAALASPSAALWFSLVGTFEYFIWVTALLQQSQSEAIKMPLVRPVL